MGYKEIGRKLQKAREEAGFSQEELARKLGCTQASLSNYELGKRRIYSADLQRIGEILGKPITYFLENPEEDQTRGDGPDDILKDSFMRELICLARDLRPDQRKSVLDFIKWQKNGGGK